MLDGRPIACRWIVGADGERSQVREWVGLAPLRPPSLRFGFRRHFAVAPWADVVEVYWCGGAQVFVTPVAPSEVCVAAISRSPRTRLADVLAACPELEGRLAGAPATTLERGAIAASRRLAAVTSGHVALIGEASGSIDAVTGEGLSVTFHHALALAQALAAGDPGRYEAAHRRILRVPAFMAHLLLAMDRLPWLRRRALLALTGEAGLFSRLLALHVSSRVSPGRAAGSLCRLGWRLLTV
jgi:flavin-dependent dehydrogenase